MRFLLLSLFFAGQFLMPAFSQNSNPEFVQAQIRRILKEKIRVENLSEAIEFWKNNPGQPLPGHFFETENEPAASRSAEIVVHDDELAESEIHAAINPTDSANIIVAAIIQDVANFLDPLKVPVYYSKNFGASWQTGNLDTSPGASLVLGGGDPVLAFDRSGKAYLSWLILALDGFSGLKLTLYLAQSTNKGQTWTRLNDPIDFGEASLDVILGGSGAGSFVDKQWMAVDQNANSPHEGNLYVTYTWLNAVDSTNVETKILLKKKAKNANAFSDRVSVNTGVYGLVQFSSVDVDAEGNIHVLFFAGNSDEDLALYHAKSTDGGASFQPELKISNIHFSGIGSTEIENPIAGIDSSRLYPCPHLKVGKAPGLLFATWTADGVGAQEAEGYDIYFSKSTNYGQTWTTPVTLNDATNPVAEQYYPAMTVNANGTLSVAFYDRSDDPLGTNTHHVIVASDDNGSTFSQPLRVTTEASDFAQIGALNGGFGIGEYTGIVSTGSYAIPVWADGRSNDGDIDVYCALVSLGNPSSGVQEIGSLTDAFALHGPNPNPAANAANFSVELKRPTDLLLTVLDASGKIVFREESVSRMPAGIYARTFPLAPGTYFLKIETEFGWKTKKVLVAGK